ncbi:hypothetical protein HDU83_000593 [Entophlyctis luteolus]|nr:hypothetical protein HDU83_000593 [Entophlyctis luteolus]KAJ3389478.1 hypothetical protein HDU84_008701 [Entophlyctis sp. JEL0112]
MFGKAVSLIVAACASLVSAGDGCTSSTGSSLSIIQPAMGTTFSPGDSIKVVWNIVNPSGSAYENLPLTLQIGNAVNPLNVVVVASLTTSPASVYIGNLTASATIPSTITAGTNYTIEAQYKDVSTSNGLVCFSPQFAVKASTVATTAAAAAAATKTTTSGAANVFGAASVGAFIAGAITLL